MCTDRAQAVRELLLTEQVWLAGFDMRPSSLFEGVAQRLCIFTARRAHNPTRVWVGGFRPWSTDERVHLIAHTQFVNAVVSKISDPLPKTSTDVETRILAKITGSPLSSMTDPRGRQLYVHRICRYFIKALNFVPLFIGSDGKRGKSEDYKEFRFTDDYSPVALCLINRTLFYWFWRTHGDRFHCGYGDVYLMTLPALLQEEDRSAFARLENELMTSLKRSSSTNKIETKRGTIQYQEFYPGPCKPLLDRIDGTLAKHCTFSEDESDFIINYDMKYRMGADQAEDAE